MHPSRPMLSIAIPVDLRRRPRDLIDKLKGLVGFPGMERMEIVVAHNDRGTRHDRALARDLRALSHVKLHSLNYYAGPVNSGYLRNRAVEAATAPILLLLDADISPDPKLFAECAERLARNEVPLVMLPCLYLTKWASRRLTDRKETPEDILKAYFSFRRRHFQHMASPSSILLLRRQDYWEVGGFDEAFMGHGYEDFDFALRLAMHHGMIPLCEELLENRGYRAPLLAEGFRKHLGRISLPYLLEKKVAFHLYHGKSVTDDYYQARAANAERLATKIQQIILRTREESPMPSSLIDTFFSLCRDAGVEAREYFVLFDTRPGHIDRLATWSDRFRFLIGRY